MQTIKLTPPMRLLLLLIAGMVTLFNCSEKITAPEPDGNVSIELRTTPHSTALASVVNLVVLTIWADDLDPIVDSLTYDGMPLAFVHTIPSGTKRHFRAEAYRIDASSGAMKLIYEGSTVVDIGADARTSVPIRMMAVVPLIRAFPHHLEIPCGIPLEIKVEAFQMAGLLVAELSLDQNGARHWIDSVVPGSSVDTLLDTFDAMWEGDWNQITVRGAGPLADAEEYSHLATFHFESRFFVGEDSLTEFSVTPLYIYDPTLFDSIVYYETSDITVQGLNDVPVSFPDSTLSRRISALVQVPGQLFLHDVLPLSYLSAAEAGIADLTNISSLMNLDYLTIGANPISDPSPLSGMAKLRVAELSSCNISDLSGLQKLPRLYSLSLRDNQIVDLRPILTNSLLGDGDTLDVSYNPLDDYSINYVIPALKARGVRVGYLSGPQ